MDHLRRQRQRIFAIEQQQSELISDLHVWTRRKICNTHATETDVLRLADAERLFQALVFDGQSDSRSDVITRIASPIVRCRVSVVVAMHCPQ